MKGTPGAIRRRRDQDRISEPTSRTLSRMTGTSAMAWRIRMATTMDPATRGSPLLPSRKRECGGRMEEGRNRTRMHQRSSWLDELRPLGLLPTPQ
jgi:hypothetical protein